MMHMMFAILLIVFVGGYLAARYAGDCDMGCDADTAGALDAGEGRYQCGGTLYCLCVL